MPDTGLNPSKNPDYKVTNTIFLPTSDPLWKRSDFSGALIKIRNPRFHVARLQVHAAITRLETSPATIRSTRVGKGRARERKRERSTVTEAFKLASESFVLPCGPTLLRINQSTLHNVQRRRRSSSRQVPCKLQRVAVLTSRRGQLRDFQVSSNKPVELQLSTESL